MHFLTVYVLLVSLVPRLGQSADVVRMIYMIAKGTMDEIVWKGIQSKHNVLGATVG